MGFHIRHRELPHVAVRRIAVSQVRASINDLRSRHPSTHEAVHEFRKRCKKIRGLLRLLRGELGRSQYTLENQFYRDLSRQLSFVRDTQALVEAVDRLTQHFGTHDQPENDLSEVRRYLVHCRDNSNGGKARLIEKLESISDQLESALQRIDDWHIEDQGFATYEPGLMQNYRRARRGMRKSQEHPTSTNFHEWRKRVKYHWHHTMLLRKTCSPIFKPHRRMTESLGELLGQYQDYSVLRSRLSDVQQDGGFDLQRHRLMQLIEIRQGELREQAFYLGHYLLAETPRRLATRWGAYWNTWNDGAPDR